jgi:hypothetical protein
MPLEKRSLLMFAVPRHCDVIRIHSSGRGIACVVVFLRKIASVHGFLITGLFAFASAQRTEFFVTLSR